MSRSAPTRPLVGRFPYLWLDAKIEKVRHQGTVRQKALVVAYAVNQDGQREVRPLDVGEAETEAFWTEFLHDLRARGSSGAAGDLRRPSGLAQRSAG